MQRIAMSTVGVAAILVATAYFHQCSAGTQAAAGPHQIVADVPALERDLLMQVDVKGCRDQVIAGQEDRLSASSSRIERQELARQGELIAKYCTCKFHETETFLTKGEMITQWLSAQATLSDPLPKDTRAKLDKVIEDCAERYGLRT